MQAAWETSTKVPNRDILFQAQISSMCTFLKQGRLPWPGHVPCMEDSGLSTDLLYGELTSGKRPTGWPQLRYKDICKCNMESLSKEQRNLKAWRLEVQVGLQRFEHFAGTWRGSTKAKELALQVQPPHRQVTSHVALMLRSYRTGDD